MPKRDYTWWWWVFVGTLSSPFAINAKSPEALRMKPAQDYEAQPITYRFFSESDFIKIMADYTDLIAHNSYNEYHCKEVIPPLIKLLQKARKDLREEQKDRKINHAYETPLPVRKRLKNYEGAARQALKTLRDIMRKRRLSNAKAKAQDLMSRKYSSRK